MKTSQQNSPSGKFGLYYKLEPLHAVPGPVGTRDCINIMNSARFTSTSRSPCSMFFFKDDIKLALILDKFYDGRLTQCR